MVVVNLMKIIGCGHFLEIALHPLLVQLMRICLLVPRYYLRILQPHISQLIPKGKPARHAVIRSTEQFNLLAPGTHPLDQPVNFVRLSACLPHLADNHIAVQLNVNLGRPFDPDQTVLFGMVEPVSRLACYDQPIYLIGLYPHQFVHPPVTPLHQTLTAQLHRTARHPQKNQTFVLQNIHPQIQQFLILEGAIRQGHVDIPRRVSHHHIKLTQNLEIKVSQVAVYPLSVLHPHTGDHLLLRHLQLLVLLHIVDQFAIGVVTCVEMGTVAETLVSILVYYRPEVLLRAHGMPACLLTFIPCAVITVLQILLLLELQSLNFLFIAHHILQLSYPQRTCASISIFSPNSEGALSRFSIFSLSSFSFGVASRFCC